MRYRYRDDQNNRVNFGEMDDSFFLIGLLNQFMNGFQTVGDRFFNEISWKQCFVLICIRFFEKPPTLKEVSELMGSSHQNIKQMLMKLENTGYVAFTPDQSDKRKQRIVLTEKTQRFMEENDASSSAFMEKLFWNVGEENLKITVQTILTLDEQLRRIKI